MVAFASVVVGGQDTTGGRNDGNELLPRCQAAIASLDKDTWKDTHESFSAGFCLGLVEGISYASPSVCPTKGVTLGQLERVLVKFLQDNPEQLNLNERELVVKALSKVFPCRSN